IEPPLQPDRSNMHESIDGLLESWIDVRDLEKVRLVPDLGNRNHDGHLARYGRVELRQRPAFTREDIQLLDGRGHRVHIESTCEKGCARNSRVGLRVAGHKRNRAGWEEACGRQILEFRR